jgi:hypothetical protein
MPFRCSPSGYRSRAWCRGFSGLGAGGTMLLAATSASAAPVGVPSSAPMRGVPVAQNFLHDHGANVSLVATPGGVTCVASRALPIREADYREPDGIPVGLDRIVRSPASSIQAIARRNAPVAFRIQLKYPPASDAPIILDLGAESVDLGDAVEPSRDSLWLAGAAAEALAEALARGEAPRLRATSSETGHQVTDRIDPPEMAGLQACVATLSALDAEAAEGPGDAEVYPQLAPAQGTAEQAGSEFPAAGSSPDTVGAPVDQLVLAQETAAQALPVPVADVRVEFTARPDPTAQLSQDDLLGCRMRDIPDELYVGRLTAVTGFFSQTQDVYVAFDQAGRPERAYVPGIFDADLAEGTNAARLSLAADSNVPDQPNTVRGCLGDARLQASVCVYPGGTEGAYLLAGCGVLGVFEEVAGLLSQPIGWTAPSRGPAGFVAVSFGSTSPGGRSVPPGGGGGAGGGGGGGGSSLPPPVFPLPPDGPDAPPPGGGPQHPPADIPPIPLPAAVWLLLGGLASLTALRAARRRAVDG